MRFVRWAAIGLAAIVVLLLVAVTVIIVMDRMAQPAPADTAPLIARAAHYQVRIKRDSWGVPHIEGKTDADAAFGLGFAQSEDDFATLQEVTLASRGTLAATDGMNAAVTDYLVHLFRVWENVNARYATDIPPDVRKVVEAYADGANYYAALHPDVVKPGALPFTGKDIIAGFVFKTPFFYGLDGVLRDLNSPKPTDTSSKTGSNGLAIAPSRSADGATRLLVNSHQPYAGPVAWYEVVLESGEGWHVAGGVFPGSPFMLHGHSAHLGWANTVNDPDLADVYQLTINPENENQYKLDGKWTNFEKSDAALRVKLFGPLIWTVHRDVLWSQHGPVLKTDHGVYAIRYAGMNEIRQVVQYYRLNKARDLAEWKAAMALGYLPSINYVYADEKGNIGYVYNGEFPVRKPGFDWQGNLPGDRSDLIWNTFLPFDKLLQVWNPPSGFVFNSNNTPFRSTAPADNPKPENYPAWMGIQDNMTNRAYRAEETFGGDTSISAEEFHTYKFDLAYSPRSEVAAEIADVLKVDSKGDADLKAAQGILRNWDRKTDIHNRGTALAVAMGLKVSQMKRRGTPTTPLAALQEAIANLKSHFGRIDPEWGQLNRMRRGKYDLPIDGGPDVYRAVYAEPEKAGTLTAMDGDTLIMFVTWDKDGKLSSESIHQFGSATLDKTSRHYDDQVPLFLKMQLKPVWFTGEQLKGHIEADYRPGEKHG